MKRVDERDTMFARVGYEKGTKAYEDYYRKNPDKKAIDDSIRTRPHLCSEGTMTYNALNSPMAGAAFDFLGDIKHLCEGPVNPEKVEGNTKIITKRIKGLAKKYGANLVGITELKDYHFYTHRGRHAEDYGQQVQLDHKYGIVFAVEMDKDMINRGPMIAEVIETSKCYVDAAIIGMILSYYIRSLGYEARNHMDANYLLMPVLVAKDAGLGEIGRNTILTTKEYGSRIRLGVVTTNLELEIDDPISFGLEDFCRLCKNCGLTCPSQSISNETEKETNGNLNWVIDQETCYIKWRYLGTDCGMCISSCPFSQEMESIKNIDTFEGNDALIADVLSEFRKKYGKRPFVPGNPDWLR
ncbi:4Fe-4S dicluster domain-containing protein [Natronincola ferrireducens]|uniref:Reductive dehalogenase n=1 Tax=Natronincola ferrireducens TaxID=393762 RepID=A0A1G9DTB4_9FIRM|nr:reductive dehalogenase domain-containing protein [Natronincola ferrireducens]SDK67146.1 reductive dehalogenase [Natronincola ferrireducens]